MAQPLTEENLDAEVDAALERAMNENEQDGPRIVEATFHRDLNLFVLKISNGQRLLLPREDLQFVADATPEQAADFTIAPRGEHIWWTVLDEGFRLEGLLEGRTGNAKWMAQLQRRLEVAA
jgi:hypothetical protein